MCLCFSSSWSCCCCCVWWSSHFSFQCCCVNGQWSSHSSQWCFFFSFLVLLSLLLMLLLLPLGITVVFSMQLLFPLDVVVFFNATPFWRGCSCSSFLFNIIPSPFRHHCCFSMALLLLFFINIVPIPLRHCSSSCFSLMLFMFFLDTAPPRQHFCSSTTFLPLRFLDTTLVPFQHHSYFCCLTSLLLLLFFNTSPSPLQCHSYSSLTPILFLLLQVPLYSPSMLFFLSTMLSFLLFYISTSPLHVFVSVGRANFPNLTCLFQTNFEGEFVFFFSNVCFLMILFLVLIVYVFFLDNVCRNPNLGLATKACKRARQEGNPGDTPYILEVQENVRVWTLTLPRQLPLGELESRRILEFSLSNRRGQNPLVWKVLYIIEKLLKHRCLKWARITHLDIWNTSYGQKKGQESNWQFDSRPLKVENRPDFLVCRWRATYHWKALNEGYNFISDLILIRRLHTKGMGT